MPNTTSSSQTGFLDLPLVIRHQIYRHTLHTDDYIDVDAITNIRQPALLQAHPVIREEAAPVYYFGNRFSFDMPDYDPTSLIAFNCHAPEDIDATAVSAYYDIGDYPSCWANLMRWMKAWYDGQASAMVPVGAPRHPLCSLEIWFAGKAFDMADVLMSNSMVIWEEIRTVLEEWKVTTEELVTWT